MPAPTHPGHLASRRGRRLALGTFLLGLGTVLASRCSSMRDGPPRALRAEGPWAALIVEPAFPQLAPFDRPVLLTSMPGDPEFVLVAEQGGLIHRLRGDESVRESQVFLDLCDRVSREGEEEGLLGLAFPPDFASSRHCFVNFVERRSRNTLIASFEVDDSGRALLDSERRILEIPQPRSNNNGGTLAFGPDGMLYVAVGDGGGSGDPDDQAQDLGSLLGSILRLDVSASANSPADQPPYRIPADNPFVGSPGARGEIWAFGFRNPWRLSFDRETGALWVADAGRRQAEEVDVVLRGGNYGWPAWEGMERFREEVSAADAIPPLATYSRETGACIVGGAVYRGARIPGLVGAYIFADHTNGSIWAIDDRVRRESRPPLRLDPPESGSAGPGSTDAARIVDSARAITSFGEDGTGELYALALDGQVYRFATGALPERPHPARLSDTGLYADLGELQPAARALPYEVAAPLWSDGADKDRFALLPEGQKVQYRDDQSWGLPVGTRVVKTFSLGDDARDPASRRRLETRVIRREDDGWSAVSYVWNQEQDEAHLAEHSVVLDLSLLDQDGQVQQRRWEVPSRGQCARCHTQAAGFLLGLNTAQLEGVPRSEGSLVDEWHRLGALDRAPAPSDQRPRLSALGDAAASLDARARSYLDSNCAPCHQPGAPGNTGLDLRHHTSLADSGLLDAPARPPMDERADRIVRPGSPERSLLLERLQVVGEEAMPPLARALPHAEAIALLRDWILEMAPTE